MAQILGGTVAKKATGGKRRSDAAAATSSIVGIAAALAATKRLRPLSLSGPDVGAPGISSAFAKQGEMERNSRASMAIVGMVISEGLPGDFTQKPRAIAAFEAYSSRQRTSSPLAERRPTAHSSAPSPRSTTATPMPR